MAISSDRQFNRYSISAIDFGRAVDFATEAQRHPANSILHEALVLSAIVCYCRPFSLNELTDAAEAAKRITIEVLGLDLTPEQLQLHEQCKSLRNEAIAHSAWSRNPTRLRDSGVVVSRPFSLLSVAFDVPMFIQLAEAIRSKCEQQRADFVLAKRRNS